MAGNTKNFIENITFEDARIVFRNFSGKEGQYNREGDRNFCLILDHKQAKKMEADGWNIKYLKPREDGDEPQPYIQVAVGYGKGRPPRVVLITHKGRNNLTEAEVGLVDWIDIEYIDLIVRPYQWAVSGKSGVKAYLNSIYVTIREDELERKYADVPDSAQNLIGSSNETLQIESGGRIPYSEDEIVIEDDGPPWATN